MKGGRKRKKGRKEEKEEGSQEGRKAGRKERRKERVCLTITNLNQNTVHINVSII